MLHTFRHHYKFRFCSYVILFYVFWNELFALLYLKYKVPKYK